MSEIAIVSGLLLVAVFSVRPLISRGYFPMHDDTQVARVVSMGRAIREVQFPVRWVADLGYGYGYPLYNFYGPLPYYFGGFLYALGVSGLSATKFMMLVGMLLPVIFMYGFVRSLSGRIAGLVAGLVLGFAPYHAVQLYVRGAVGELWAVAWMPFVLWGAALIKTRKTVSSLVLGIGLSAIILSHTILGYTSVVVYLLLASLVYLGSKSWDRGYTHLVRPLFLGLLIALGFSAFFWLPAAVEMNLTSVSGQIGATADYQDHFLCVRQLWDGLWGFAGSAPGCQSDGMSFALGKLHILLAVTGVIVMQLLRSGFPRQAIVVNWIFAVTLAMASLTLVSSHPVWRLLPGAAYIQYPWRFLAYVIIGLSAVSGIWLVVVKTNLLRIVIAVVIILFLVAGYGKLFTGQFVIDAPDSSYETAGELRYRASRVSDEYLPPGLPRPSYPQEVARDTIIPNSYLTVDVQEETAVYGKYWLTQRQPAVVTVNRVYFPGWKYWWNSQLLKPVVKSGLPELALPGGSGTLEIRFTDTPIRLLGNVISLITLGVTLFVYGKKTIT